ncbi:hypothetical protein ACFVV7_35685 [Streptomyces globisporus]|uniref:hypothetical protein n=1 Tax=Streptomyces globisporus TaxID=1908 RepID=UPI0036DDC45B
MPQNLTITSDFFEPHRTYTDATPYKAPEAVRIFEVEFVTRHPDRGHLRAVGWMRAAAPGAKRHMQKVDENEYRRGDWQLHTSTATLLGEPDEDGPTPVLLVCTYVWSCSCEAPAVIVYADGPTSGTALIAADDAAWAHAGGLELALANGEHVDGTEHHQCDAPQLNLTSALRTLHFAAPQIQTPVGRDSNTILRVHARHTDGATA